MAMAEGSPPSQTPPVLQNPADPDPPLVSAVASPCRADDTPKHKRRRLAGKTPPSQGEGEGRFDELDGQAPDSTDNANYFCEYAYLYHQMDMLEDSVRTMAYRRAIMMNQACFEGKTVLDVGAGTCILSIMAAQAGASQVFAVEATDMAKRGRRIIEANGLGSTIRVIQGTMESVELPCKVDIIVSEWMGYFLLRESMLDSVLFAREKFLKPGGALFPSHAELYLAPVGQLEMLQAKRQQLDEDLERWSDFVGDMKLRYKTDFSCVRQDFEREQRKYNLQTGTFAHLAPDELVGPSASLLKLDLLDIKLQELQTPTAPHQCSMTIARDGPVEGFCGYFDAFFRGSPSNPVEHEMVLPTGPTSNTSTHWGQQVFGFNPPLMANQGDTLECTMWLTRQAQNHRLLQMAAKFSLHAPGKAGSSGRVKEERTETYFLD